MGAGRTRASIHHCILCRDVRIPGHSLCVIADFQLRCGEQFLGWQSLGLSDGHPVGDASFDDRWLHGCSFWNHADDRGLARGIPGDQKRTDCHRGALCFDAPSAVHWYFSRALWRRRRALANALLANGLSDNRRGILALGSKGGAADDRKIWQQISRVPTASADVLARAVRLADCFGPSPTLKEARLTARRRDHAMRTNLRSY